ncbi:MAG: phosphoribosylamine--glycine ligase [bacterium]|nr:phosphoribosylamine--glycine ligase [bacterium]
MTTNPNTHVLVIGSGGREHTICWAMSQSKRKPKLFCAPGNGGTSEVATNLPVKADDIAGLLKVIESEKIGFVVIGPEAPLVIGLSDKLTELGIPVFGPSGAAAMLEGSKAFSKELMLKNNIPTARYQTYTNFDDAVDGIGEEFPVVIKASGLAAGKGVVIARNQEEAEAVLRSWMLDKKLGDAGKEIVIEQFLVGQEVSLFVLADGETFQVLPPVQDHKRLLEDDRGFNTGGMGSCAPSPVLDNNLMGTVVSRIVKPTLAAMTKAGTPFRGVLFIGLIICNGEPYVLEYNVRFGDPETQSLLPLLNCDVFELLLATATGELDELQSHKNWLPDRWESLAKKATTLCVVLAARGYPNAPNTGMPIELTPPEIELFHFHAGTTRTKGGALTVCGGRVVSVVALGHTILETRERAYRAAREVKFEGKMYRQDIGSRMITSLHSGDDSRHGASLRILGSSSGMPSVKRYNSSYWLEVEGDGYLIDCGEGASRSILEQGIDPLTLRAVFISHTHPDHVAGLPMLLQMLHLLERRDPLPVYLPLDKVAVFSQYLAHLYLLYHVNRFSYQVNLSPLSLEPYEDERIRLEPFTTTHLEKYREAAEPLGVGCVSQGFRFIIGDRIFVYPSDIPNLDGVVKQFENADLLLIETTHIHPFRTAETARDLKIPRVVLTHIPPHRENAVDEWRALGVKYQIPWFEVAHDGLKVSF